MCIFVVVDAKNYFKLPPPLSALKIASGYIPEHYTHAHKKK